MSRRSILYWTLKTPHALDKLQDELDKAIPSSTILPEFSAVKDLPYLKAVINETLRIHSTSSLGLPREIPTGAGPGHGHGNGHGLELHGHHLPPGTVVSVPSYTVHRARGIWGADADSFRPERWFGVTEAQKAAFIPFSHGPRACVGRNVAEMELVLIVATLFRRYAFELRQREWRTREGFLRKPLQCRVALRLRS